MITGNIKSILLACKREGDYFRECKPTRLMQQLQKTNVRTDEGMVNTGS